MAERRGEFGNPIRRTDDEELTGSATGTYDTTTGYRAGPEGYGTYGTTGYGVSAGRLRNPPEERGFGSESGQQQQMRPGQQQQQAGFGYGQTGSGQKQAGYGDGQTGSRQSG